GDVVDRDALRARLEQEIGFADYGKYFTGLFLDFARQLEQQGLRVSTEHGIFTPADIREFVRRRFPEPGPQSGLLQAPRSSLAATLPTDAPPEPLLRPLSPALSTRVNALLSSQS